MTDSLLEAIISHWADRAALEPIRGHLERRGVPLCRVPIEELASFDQMHVGQLAAMRLFAEWVAPATGSRILDIGSGLGGAARYLAARHGAQVAGVEASSELVETARVLTRWTGLEDCVTFICGDARTAAGTDTFDIVWLQHVDMHLPDKQSLYRSCRDRLTDKGRIVWHDWLLGPAGEPYYPVPWSADGALSAVLSEAGFKAAVEAAGMRLTKMRSMEEQTLTWLDRACGQLEKRLARGMGQRGEQRVGGLLESNRNLLRNIKEGRLRPHFSEARG